jgi:hypothetical protein
MSPRESLVEIFLTNIEQLVVSDRHAQYALLGSSADAFLSCVE